VKIDWRTVGAFQENSYLVVDPATRRAVLVDPGAEAEQLIEMVRASGATLDAIWLTHAHIDHIGAIAGVKRVWDVPIYLHPADQPLYDRGAMQAAVYGLAFEQPPAPDHALAEGDVVSVGSLDFDVLHVPGHAPGHVAFVRHGCMLGGDLLFAGSIGRTDLPLSDPERMTESLDRVAGLPEETVVYPGHGPATSIGQERATNPFLTGVARVVRR
jgi:glyoxylase-like metal-dependent hydrolase (beta-lactamase superfamily II)